MEEIIYYIKKFFFCLIGFLIGYIMIKYGLFKSIIVLFCSIIGYHFIEISEKYKDNLINFIIENIKRKEE